MSIELVLLETVKKLVSSAVTKQIVTEGEKFFTKRRIDAKIEEAIASVIEPIVPFLRAEHAGDAEIELLFRVCAAEMAVVIDDPTVLFEASLDGQKLFDRFYRERPLPDSLDGSRLTHLYTLVFPQIGNLVCALPAVTKQWSLEGYREHFKRMDTLTLTLTELVSKLDVRPKYAETSEMKLLESIRQSLLQRVDFQIDLTGLRGDRPDAVPLEKLFVTPTLKGTSVELLIYGFGFNAATLQIVVGGPGSGKSTFALWLQRSVLARPTKPITFLYRLRELARRDQLPSIVDLVRESAGVHLREEVDAQVFRQWTDAQKVVIILDGFDEIPPPKRDQFVSWINSLRQAIAPSVLVLTSRPLSTSHLRQLDAHYSEILPFDKIQVASYIEKWYANAPLVHDDQRHVDVEALAHNWISDGILSPLVRVPLTLATILMVHHIDGELPSGRSKLYERYVAGMLGLWDGRWGVASTVKVSDDEKQRILMELAVRFQIGNVDEIDDAELVPALKNILKSIGNAELPESVRDHLKERSGLLVGPGMWSFVHKSLCEYFVAAAISEGDVFAPDGTRFDRLTLYLERHNDRWNSILFFWAGLSTSGELQSFVDQILDDATSCIDCSLAAGLILDQVRGHRLPLDWRETRIRKLLSSQAFMKTIAAGNMENSDKLHFRSARLENLPAAMCMTIALKGPSIRSMSGTYVPFILRRLSLAGSMSWLETKAVLPPEIHVEVWISWLASVSSASELRDLIYELQPGGAIDEKFAVAIWSNLSSSAYERADAKLSGTQFLEIVERVNGGANMVLLPLLAALYEKLMGHNGEIVPLVNDILRRATSDVSYDMLMGSAKWLRRDSIQFDQKDRELDLLNEIRGFFESEEEQIRRLRERDEMRQRIQSYGVDGRASTRDPWGSNTVLPSALIPYRQRLLDLTDDLLVRRRTLLAAIN